MPTASLRLMAPSGPLKRRARVSLCRRVASVVGVAIVFASWAGVVSAGTVERVQVGVQGRNQTQGYSPALFVDLGVVSDYVHVTNDGDSGGWQGPAYHAEKKADLGGTVKIGWGVSFEHSGLKTEARARTLDISTWRVVKQGSVSVPHTIKGVRVGMLQGFMMVTRAPGSTSAAFASAVAFPACGGLVITAYFSSLEPSDDQANPYGNYVLADGTLASTWNHDHVAVALQKVSLDGYLPLGRLTAAAHGRTVSGKLVDCAGNPTPGAVVTVGNKHGLTGPSGAFSVLVPAAGTYTVSAAAGGSAAKAAAVRVS